MHPTVSHMIVADLIRNCLVQHSIGFDTSTHTHTHDAAQGVLAFFDVACSLWAPFIYVVVRSN